MDAVDEFQSIHLATIYLTTLEIIKLYNKATLEFPKKDRYDLTISKSTGFYQELEDAVSTFRPTTIAQVVTARDLNHTPSRFNKFIPYYSSITQAIVESHCQILWIDNSGSNLVLQPTEGYGVQVHIYEGQKLIYQQHLIFNMINLWIRNSLTTDVKRTLRYYKTLYAYNRQDDGAAVLFFIVEMVHPDTHVGCSDIKIKL